jgi:two-component system nitrogen regulation response regulator NtrX
VEKPLALEKTLLVVKNALRQRKLEAENRALKEQVEHRWVMVGRAPAIQRAARRHRAGRALQRPRADLRRERARARSSSAATSTTRALRASGPFVEVNCAAIPRS